MKGTLAETLKMNPGINITLQMHYIRLIVFDVNFGGKSTFLKFRMLPDL